MFSNLEDASKTRKTIRASRPSGRVREPHSRVPAAQTTTARKNVKLEAQTVLRTSATSVVRTTYTATPIATTQASTAKAKTPDVTATSTPNASATAVKDNSEGIVQNVPVPVPDTGLPPVSDVMSQVTALLTSASSSTTQPSSAYSSTSSTMAVPTSLLSALGAGFTLQSVSPSATFGLHESTSFASSLSASASQATSQRANPSSASHGIGTVIIVLVAVGACMCIAGICIIRKVCTRPVRGKKMRGFPKPSKPTLHQDLSTGLAGDVEESPLFGGKEHFNSTSGSQDGFLQPWTQYSAPGGEKAHPNWTSSPLATPPRVDFVTAPVFDGATPSMVQAPTAASKAYQMQGILKSTASRLSTMSSRSLTAGGAADVQVGLAVTNSPLTGDGHATMGRAAADRRRSRSKSQASLQRASVYDGVDVASPEPPVAPMPRRPPIARSATSGAGSRERVKSPEAHKASISSPSLYRMSRASNPFEDGYDLPAKPQTARKGTRAQQDVKALSALTSALGLDGPTSPGLGPDDSLSMVGGYDRAPAGSKRRLQEALAAVEADLASPSESLGGLMLLDFDKPSQSSSRSVEALVKERKRMSKATSVYSVSTAADGPPRVPSPPPLPSLAQMGLEHSDPGYDDYRSPTYSLYAMYGERKS
ncbi:hypothetical protein PUNSTDRAFT_127053 [Punctularia strigosozonata HHB-11173 SS5]|uniref:uncharacterized protein n=1 Tax=Punctularia strigosozonata (strain HHB-11173) TaxID=741275 RepID=UPI00044163F2|nr:uncharacterized protein PUNSTDRAFT_127053 [Punctularia strigosozonata HHB-11173 SS5]EIN07282.1 hypothetical protein PUNSTDRAFT_127053 [Punctularia strigosozonata HHB-11173 SS5]